MFYFTGDDKLYGCNTTSGNYNITQVSPHNTSQSYYLYENNNGGNYCYSYIISTSLPDGYNLITDLTELNWIKKENNDYKLNDGYISILSNNNNVDTISFIIVNIDNIVKENRNFYSYLLDNENYSFYITGTDKNIYFPIPFGDNPSKPNSPSSNSSIDTQTTSSPKFAFIQNGVLSSQSLQSAIHSLKNNLPDSYL